MTNKLLIILLLIIGSIGRLCAQDFIVLKTGKEIKAKIVELSPTEIRYKEFQNPNSPTLNLDKKHVFMVRYESGINEVVNAINTPNKEADTPPQQSSPKSVTTTQSEQNPAKTEGTNTYPQNVTKPIIIGDDNNGEGFTVGIFVGGAVPLKSYASPDFKKIDKASGAKPGFCAGLQMGYKTRYKINFILEGQYTLNSYELKLEDVRNIYTLRGDWQHIAALMGARSEMSLSKNVSLYALSLGGLSFASVSGDFAEVLDILDTKTKSKSFAYSLGFGLILKKNMTIGIRTINSNPVFGDYKQSAYNMQATVGFQF